VTRRVFTMLLALLMLVALVPAGAVQASAASSYTCSDEFIDIVKDWEGFRAKPYWDVSHYSIGYGTMVPDDKLEEWKENGITEEEAEQFLREHLKANETRVNSFIDKYEIKATQGIFDALVSISFNCGSSWLYKESTLRTAVIEGWTGNDLLFAFGQWSTAGGSTRTSLINRRMCECNMYLNGAYSGDAPENYTFVRFDPNGGTCEIKTQCFDTNTPAEIRAVPTYEGYTFEGWYTDATGGEKVTKLDSSVKEYMLYAHWSAKEGTDVPENTITGTKVNYTCKVTASELNAFSSPVSGAAVVATYKENETVTIVSEYTDANGTKWGETSKGGWINLAYTSAEDAADTMSVQVTVTGNSVNIRKGPGTSYASVKQVNKGYKLTITQTKTAGGYTWGKSSEGWIALKYTNFDSVSSGNNSGNTGSGNTGSEDTQNKVIATGKVAVKTKLNIRKGAGTGYAVVGTLSNGASVEIYETKLVGSVTWGRIAKGWISLEYVQLDKQEEEPENPGTGNEGSGNTGSGDTGSGNEGSGNTGSGNEGSGNTGSDNTGSGSTEPAKTTGTVKVDSWLNVRSGAGTNYSVVARLTNGTKVEITEQKTVKGTVWGKMSKGWVSMDYIVLDKTEETKPVTGTISCGTAQLRIRTAPNGDITGNYLVTGDKVTILEQKTVNDVLWGRIDKGWIMMKYVILDSTDSGNTSTTVEGTITGDYLRIRSGPGTSYSIVGFLHTGDKVTILETKTVGGTKWGRIAKGWISMDYVKV